MFSRGILPPIVLQIIGLATFIFFCGFWAVTGRVEPLLLAGSGTLYGAGLVNHGGGSFQELDESPPIKPNEGTQI